MGACYLPPLVILQCALCNFLGITAYLRRSGGKFFPLHRERLVGIVGVIMIIFALHLNIANVLNCFFSLQESIAPPPWALLCVCTNPLYHFFASLEESKFHLKKSPHTYKGKCFKIGALKSNYPPNNSSNFTLWRTKCCSMAERLEKNAPSSVDQSPTTPLQTFVFVLTCIPWQSGVTPP